MYIRSSTTGYSIPKVNSIQIRALIIGITILFIILMGVVSATASESNDNTIPSSVTIIPLTQTVLVGEPFDVDVVVDPAGLSTAGLQFNLNYNSSVVTINSVTEGNFLNQNGAFTLFNPGTIDNIGGNLTDVYGVIFGRVSVSTSGTFATISMTANSPGFSTLNLSNVIVSNSFGYSIPVIINNGSVSISGELLAEAAAPSTGTVNAPISFTGSATGGTGVYAIWHWKFGDDESSDEQNPSYAYTTAGTYTVNLTITDSAGNSATATQTVTITDTTAPTITAPTITAPSDITEEATGALTTVDFGLPVFNDPLATVTNDAPSTFPVGETIITWTATDVAGNSATATQSVTITDTTAPEITVPADIATEATGSQTSVVIGTATATDAVDGPVSVTNNAPSTFHVGETIITWTTTDIAGNSATATQTVTITDTTAPEITVPADIATETTGSQTSVSIGTATATDLVDGPVSVTNNAPSKFSVSETIVTWTATDVAGNSAIATQKVTITDTNAPAIIITSAVDGSTVTISQIKVSGSASDDSGIANVTVNGGNAKGTESWSKLLTLSEGDNMITVVATDNEGNSATRIITVTYNILDTIDVTPPEFDSINYYPAVAYAGAVVNVSAVVSDDSGVKDVMINGVTLSDQGDGIWAGSFVVPMGTSVGEYVVFLTADDTAGNSAETTLNYNIVNPVGGIAITSTPKPLMLSSGTSGVMNVKLRSSANFDDIVEVTLDISGFPAAYTADMSWFDRTSVMVQVPAGQTVLVPFDVSIPAGATGYKVFKDSARSFGFDATSMDTGVVYVT